jgi:hypothetical protein
MESQALHPGKGSTSRRLLIVAVLLSVLVGLSLLARRTGLISWDLQPVVQGQAQTIQIDTNVPAGAIDRPVVGLVPPPVLRRTDNPDSGDILPPVLRPKPIANLAPRKPEKKSIKSNAPPVDPCGDGGCGITDSAGDVPEEVSDHRKGAGPLDEDTRGRDRADDLSDDDHHHGRDDTADEDHGHSESHDDGHDRGDDSHDRGDDHGGCHGRRG